MTKTDKVSKMHQKDYFEFIVQSKENLQLEYAKSKSYEFLFKHYVEQMTKHPWHIPEYYEPGLKRMIVSTGAAGTHHVDKILGSKNNFLPALPFHLSGPSIQAGRGSHVRHPIFIKQAVHSEDLRVLYLTSHPIMTLLSYWNRKFFDSEEMIINIGGDCPSLTDFIFRLQVKRNVNDLLPSQLEINEFFELYLENRQNFFHFADHINRWKNADDIKVLPVKYEDFQDRFEEICHFLDLKEYLEIDLQWKPRTSSYEVLDPSILSRLLQIHAEDIEAYNGI